MISFYLQCLVAHSCMFIVCRHQPVDYKKRIYSFQFHRPTPHISQRKRAVYYITSAHGLNRRYSSVAVVLPFSTRLVSNNMLNIAE